MPLYIMLPKQLGVNVFELLGHRVMWSFLLLLPLVTIMRGWAPLFEALKSPRTRALLAGSTVVISFNWIGYIYAVYTDQISQASLGYYINPLVSVLLGMIFLKETLNSRRKIALGIAALGVIYQTAALGVFPWIALFLAFSFGSYGLLRKLAPVAPYSGLVVETAGLTPLMLILFIVLNQRLDGGLAILSGSTETLIVLPLAGVLTATPLIFFAAAARRLSMATIGFMQYINPTLQLLVAVFIGGEPFTAGHAISFGLIWAALLVYSADLYQNVKKQPDPVES